MIRYTFKTIADLFQVPLEKRDAMMQDLRMAIETATFVYGDKAAEYVKELTWTDDGEPSVSVIENGNEAYTLKVTMEQA